MIGARGDYREALEQMPVNPDVTLTAAYRFKYGFGLNWEQEVTKDLGIFARLGWNDGHTETWAFTAIDRLAEIGFLLKGKRWCRPNDAIGLAGCVNGLSGDHRNYLGAGTQTNNGSDVFGAVSSQGYNLIGTTNGSSGWAAPSRASTSGSRSSAWTSSSSCACS